MIGAKQLVIDASDFIKGMSSGTDISDGGFSNETDAVNLTYSPGVLYASAQAVDKSANLTGEAIAWCASDASGSPNGFLLANDGKIMSIDASQVLAASSALTGTWTTGTSDIVQFIDKIYATSTTDIARMDTNLTNGDHDWWSTTLSKGVLTSGCRHPMVKFIGYLFVGDLNTIHRVETSAAGTADHLVLGAENQITALGIDESSGRMLVATTHGANYSNTIATTSKVFVYDGVSPTPEREVTVDGMVTAFKNVGGTTYVAFGQKLGYWNGSGVTFLRKLKNVTLAGADLAYKHHLANIGNTLYVVDGKQILAFGEVLPGKKVFYYTYSNNNSLAGKFTLVCPVGDNKLGLGYSTSVPSKNFDTLDTTSVSNNNSMTWNSLRYAFPRPIYLRSVYLEYADAVGTNDNNRQISYKYEKLGSGFNLLRIQGQATNESIKNLTGSSIYFIDNIVGFTPDKVRMLQLRYITDTTNIGLKRIIVYYDVAE